ncbi:MAG: hypothetical protein ACMUIS_09395 [bacterium]
MEGRCVDVGNAKRTIMLCVAVTLVFAITQSTALAQIRFGFPPLWDFPSFSSQPLQVPTWEDPFKGEGDILVDNFEYWDSPYNHGWRQSEPPYPVYGFGMGYATVFNTVLDLQEGSRVLDVYRPASVFLLSTPYEKHAIIYSLFTPPSAADTDGETGIDMATNGVVSFDFRAPLGIEPWDIFEMDVIGETVGGDSVTVRIVPLQPPAGACLGTPVNTTEGMYGTVAVVTGFNESAGQMQVTVSVGRGLLDGSWHAVWVDIDDAVTAAVDNFDDIDTGDRDDWYIETALAVLVSGQMFRLDNLLFRANYGHVLKDYPDLFEMGPLYAQLFEPYRYLFIADYAGGSIKTYSPIDPNDRIPQRCITDLMLYPELYFITDPNEIEDIWIDEYGADPNLFGKEPDPNVSELMGRDFIVDINLPIFADPNNRLGTPCSERLQNLGALGWNATVGGYGANGTQAFLLSPLQVNPYDGMPTYFPAYYASLECIRRFGKPYFRPELVFLLESAMWNTGMTVWPNVAALDYTPQYFEDLIVTIEVTNGVHSDVRTFPITVVNYSVENYAPVLQLDIDDQIFYVGEVGKYIVNFIDPDCFIFSRAQPAATTHTPGFPVSLSYREDMDELNWSMVINGLPSYQYGPWIEQIINPCSGLISWTPKFEGAYDAVITCKDAKNTMAIGEITIFAVNKGTWLNHPPIILGGPTQPLVIKAGEEFILHTPNFAVEDPDGDDIYASCNIGTCGRAPDDSFIWKFQSNFPGSYMIEIIFYDIRGGYAVMEFFMDVKPWWSY